MTQPRNSEHQTQLHRPKKDYGVGGTKGSSAAAVAGRSTYRQDFQRDYGPDPDEWLDATESGHEV